MAALTEIVQLIQRKGLKADLPVLDEAELGFATDTKELFVGSNSGNILIAKKSDIPNGNIGSIVTDSTINGKIIVDGIELTVYDDTTLNQALAGKAEGNHKHALSEMSDVDTTNKSNGYALQYDSLTNKFVSKGLPTGSGSGATNLDGLSDVDISTTSPIEGNALVFSGGLWKPKDIGSPMVSNHGSTYVIELDRWGIKKDGTLPDETAKGINNAIQWAKTNGFRHAYLPNGYYLTKLQALPIKGSMSNGYDVAIVQMPDDFHFELDKDALIEIDTNSWSSYQAITFRNSTNSRISGGKVKGDRKTHINEIFLTFERGGINPDGSLNSDPNFIRTPVLDRMSNGILSMFRVWTNSMYPNSLGYRFAQYKDTVSISTLAGYRDNGLFAPGAPTGRGWFGTPDLANKMIITIDITNDPMTDQQLSDLRVKVDNQYYTGENAHCVGIFGGLNVEVDHMELFNAPGDGVLTGVGFTYDPSGTYPDLVQLEKDMGRFIYIHHNNIHRNRRQGISLCGPNDQFVYENDIHHIGKGDDGVTPDFTAPAFGIDIESMIGESNVPAKSLYYGEDGVEVNFRINIFNNYVHHNQRGHLVNPDGSYVTVENNIFEGYTIGGIGGDFKPKYVKFINNTYIGCEQWVMGDYTVTGGVFDKGGNIRIDGSANGATITDIRIKDGMVYGNAVNGYFGSPIVDVALSTFTFSQPHLMGNTAKVSFEAWTGKAPKGIVTNKVYYVVNSQSYSFQVSETEGGKPVIFYDSGEPGFIINRYNYGRLYIDGVSVERDYRTESVDGFNVSLSGGTIKNVTVKNCRAIIKGSVTNYSGRPITVDNLTVIEGETQLNNCQVSGSKFISNYGDNIKLGTDVSYNKFQGVSVNSSTLINQKIYMGRGYIGGSKINKSNITKESNTLKSIVSDSFIEDSKIEMVGAVTDKVLLVTGSTLSNVSTTITGGSSVGSLQMLGNTDIATSINDVTPAEIVVSPLPAIFSSQQSVTLTCSKATSIRYTLDGTNPSVSSTLYTGAITIASPTIVKAIGLDASSAIIVSKSWFYDVDLLAPDVVTNLAAPTVGNSTATLTWGVPTATDVVSYEVYNGITLVTTVTTTTVTVTDLLANTSYTFNIKSVDDAGNKSANASVSFTTTDDGTPPEEVTNIIASHISDTNLGLTWADSTSLDIGSYDVYKGATLLGNSVSPNFSIINLTPSTSYTFTIKSKDKNGNTSVGVPFTVSTSATPATSFSGYVKDGLIALNKDVVPGTALANKNSYVAGTGNFTLSILAKHETNTTLLNRRILGNNPNSTIGLSLTNWGSSNAYAQVNLYGKNRLNGTYISLASNLGTNDPDTFGKMEPNAYYMITLKRTGNNFRIYLNGMDYSVLAPVTNLDIDPNYNYINGDSIQPLTVGDANHVASSNIRAFAYYNRSLTPEEITQNFQALFDSVAPGAASNLAVVSNTTGVAELSWVDPVDSDVLYKNAYYKKTIDSTWTKANPSRILTQTYQISTLLSATSYDFKIEVVDNYLNKTSSALVSKTIV